MVVGDAHVFDGFLTPVLSQLFFPKPPTTFLTCFCRGERQIYARKKSRLNRGSNSQPPGHESRSPLSHLRGALRTDRQTDRQTDFSIAPKLFILLGYDKRYNNHHGSHL